MARIVQNPRRVAEAEFLPSLAAHSATCKWRRCAKPAQLIRSRSLAAKRITNRRIEIDPRQMTALARAHVARMPIRITRAHHDGLVASWCRKGSPNPPSNAPHARL